MPLHDQQRRTRISDVRGRSRGPGERNHSRRRRRLVLLPDRLDCLFWSKGRKARINSSHRSVANEHADKQFTGIERQRAHSIEHASKGLVVKSEEETHADGADTRYER
jgi:hypothetical protein